MPTNNVCPIPLSDWPKWAKWAAKDRNGQWFFYRGKPRKKYGAWWPRDVNDSADLWSQKDWANTLTSRPEE